MRRSRRGALRAAAGFYVWLLRGTPLLVQLVLVYNGLAALGVFHFRDLSLLGLTLPGMIQVGASCALALNEGAYMAEIVRAASSASTPARGGGKAIGMRNTQTLRFIILPQAARIIVPPLGNQFNQMLKSTTLVVIIGGAELFNAFQQVNAVIFKPFELFFAASFYFLALTAIWTVIQGWMERRLDPAGQAAEAAAGRTGFFKRVFAGDR